MRPNKIQYRNSLENKRRVVACAMLTTRDDIETKKPDDTRYCFNSAGHSDNHEITYVSIVCDFESNFKSPIRQTKITLAAQIIVKMKFESEAIASYESRPIAYSLSRWNCPELCGLYK